MGTFANSEDPDEMPQNTAFHQGLHCLLRHKDNGSKQSDPGLHLVKNSGTFILLHSSTCIF